MQLIQYLWYFFLSKFPENCHKNNFKDTPNTPYQTSHFACLRGIQDYCLFYTIIFLRSEFFHPHKHFTLTSVIPVRIRNCCEFYVFKLWFLSAVKAVGYRRLYDFLSFSFHCYDPTKEIRFLFFQRCICIYKDCREILGIVDFFETIYQRSAYNCCFSRVCAYLWICIDKFSRRSKAYLNFSVFFYMNSAVAFFRFFVFFI